MKPRPFPTQLLPEPLRSYIKEAAASLDCSGAYVAVPMLPVLASAIGNARCIQLKKGWCEPSVVWATVVSESGTVKSPAYELATKPAMREQRRISRSYADAYRAYEDEHKRWKSKDKSDRGDEPEPPSRPPHVMCSDTTIEALFDRLQDTPKGTLVAIEELSGWFQSFMRYKSAGSDDHHWLQLFGAKCAKIDRKGGIRPSIVIDHASASVTGTIQPGVLGELLGKKEFESGLAARLLMVKPAKRVKQWTDLEVSDQTQSAVDEVFRNLYDLKLVPGPEGDGPGVIRLTPEAKHAFIEFYNPHNIQMQNLDAQEKSAAAKLEAYAARFALIIHCVRTATGESESDYVDADEMAAGIKLVEWFMHEISRTYSILGESAADKKQRELVEWISSRGGHATARELTRGPGNYKPTANAETALQSLVEAELGKWVPVPVGPKGGKWTREFHLIDESTEVTDNDTAPETYGKLGAMSEPAEEIAVIRRAV